MYKTQLLLQMDHFNTSHFLNKTEPSRDTEKLLMPSRCQQADICWALNKKKGNQSLLIPTGIVTSQSRDFPPSLSAGFAVRADSSVSTEGFTWDWKQLLLFQCSHWDNPEQQREENTNAWKRDEDKVNRLNSIPHWHLLDTIWYLCIPTQGSQYLYFPA